MSEPNAPVTPVADAKDWTWVTERQCPECGFDPATVSPDDLPALILGAAERFEVAVERKGAEERPWPGTWSPIEYGQHVADVMAVMTERLGLILDSDGAGTEFEDWDQDAAAVEKEYWKANGHATAVLVKERAEAAAKAWAEPVGEQWSWAGLRGNGSEFTAQSLGLYFAHDLIHHLHDVAG
ncbi:DinB family protein [Tessaracoccus sp. MC1865]|uniref:DinB family protein n=1 Tax=Tessaracoccus sp. MC1865 TaxID=2760310 RepID=UPI001603A2AC|nr:DinB family protein [Tessaracoccus sp. MC1865]MBB1484555.1 DinB family protein [Tessaracoccus sp. MC1865]QTO38353.1 DinB family protein [Tessaracoccus sp. MC1865]